MLDDNPADNQAAPEAQQDTETPSPDTPPAPDAPARKSTAKKAAAKKTATKKAAAKKTATKKAAAKKSAAQAEDGPTEAPLPEPAAEEAPAATAEGAPDAAAEKPAKKAAKKAAAKKSPAKKAAAKKSTAKKAASKKAAADEALETGEPVPGEPLAEVGEPATSESATSRQAPAAAVPLFQPPDPAKAAPRRKRAAAKPSGEPSAESGPTESSPAEDVEAAPAPRRRTRSAGAKKAAAGEDTAGAEETATAEQATETPDETAGTDQQAGEDQGSDEQGGTRRRRRRGGRRRRKGGDSGDTDNGQSDSDSDEPRTSGSEGNEKRDDQGAEEGESGSSSRRRRRRRRSGDDSGGGADDPEKTVTRVRKPRNPEDEITALSGSTRLEAKKQRRREGREAGRRRAPIVSEAEFLARREAVERVMVIRQRKDLTQIAVLEDKVLVEHYVARESQTSLIGNVYLGRVQNVLPSMEAAFIDIGKGRNAVLYAGEVNWDALGAGNGPRKIEQVLKSGQAVLVQVTKDPIGHKGARLTSQISLPGRFLVYVPDGTTSGISRKLPDTERNRLKTLLKEIVPESAGVIVRTAAEGASEEELTRDVERLTARWADIEAKVAKGNAPQLLYGEPDLTLKVVRDLFTEDFGKLVVSGDDAWDLVENYVGHVAPDLADRLERYDGGQDVFAAYRIDEQIAKALDRKVWLPSGGSLVIDRTEAMTVVDVNTGKFTGSGGNLEETVTKNNLEAAEEIVRQLRLRDIGGIIVVDFIDMVLESNRDLVLRRMVECLGRDRTRHQVAEVTSLGLVQMTRKRIGTGLLEAFSESCEHCQGRGLIIHHEPVESRKQQDDEPRRGRGRGGRGRGRDEDSGNGGATPSPKDVAAMAKPAAEKAETEKPAAERAPEPVPEEPAQADGGTSPDGAAAEPEKPAEPAKPVVRTRTRRGSSRREAGPPATSTDSAPVVGAAEPTAGSTAESPAESPAEAKAQAAAETPAEPAAAPEAAAQDGASAAPRVVTTRRRVARRPAGPPVGGTAESPNGAGPAGSEEQGASPDGTGDTAEAPAHVPVKKKGARKR
jgi:ribonuclease E